MEIMDFFFLLTTCIPNTESALVLSPWVSLIPSVTGSLLWTGPCFSHQPDRIKVTAPMSLPSTSKVQLWELHTKKSILRLSRQRDRGSSAVVHKMVAEQGTCGAVILTYL